MAISWNPSRGATVGVEWELQLVDTSTRMLRQDAREVLAALPGLTEEGEHPKIRHELMQSTDRGGHRHLQHRVRGQGRPIGDNLPT